MEFEYNLPEFSVTFTDESSWQRQKVFQTLSFLIDETAFITFDRIDTLTTTFPKHYPRFEVERMLKVAATMQKPETRPRIDKITPFKDYL